MKNPMDMTRDEMIMAWREAKKSVEAAQVAEKQLRDAIVSVNFDNDKHEGAQTVDLGNGYKLKVTKKVYYRLDAKSVDEALTELEESGEDGRFIADRLVKFKPELSISEYKKLEAEHRKIIDKVVTTSPGTPSLEFIEPKGQ